MEPCENSRWWHLTSLKDHPSPFQPRRSYNILTSGNKTHLQSPRGGEGPQLRHLWPQPKGCGGKGSPIVPAQTHHWSSGLAPTSPAAIQPPELFCCCPDRLKTAVQGPAGTQERKFLTAIISYWIWAWGPTGDAAGEGSRTNLYSFLYRQYYPIPIPLLPYSQSTVKLY